MSRIAAWGLTVLGGWLVAASVGKAETFSIDLEVQAGKKGPKAKAETRVVGEKPKPRVVVKAKAGETIKVHWVLRNTDPKATVKDVLVHFFAVREEKVGQAAVPKLGKDVAAESALTMDFPPKDSAEGNLSFTITRKGAYLIRLETIGALRGQDGHEVFAALDLVVN
jgi:hypothetical protein